MITSYDPDYINTKRIRQGRGRMHPVMELLAEWIEQTYGVRPLNIELTQWFEERISLEVIFEYPAACVSLTGIDPNNPHPGVKKEKALAVTNKFLEILASVSDESDFPNIIYRKDGLGEPRIRPFLQQDISKLGVVLCENFVRVARSDICQSIPLLKLEKLVERIGHPSLWKILRNWEWIVFMVHTEEQKRRVLKQDKVAVWTRDFLKVAHQYDEFGYLSEENFSIDIDSRERFKKEYNENLFYYFR